MVVDPALIERLTLATGSPKPDKHNSLTVGAQGPQLLADVALIEELAHFNRERIPERSVHAKGATAFGTFKTTNGDFGRDYCSADFLLEKGKKTNAVVRFSMVAGESGSADTLRDVRGFAVKMYTKEGNFDIVGINLAAFFFRDPIKFPSMVHSQKRNPKTNLKDPNSFWDFVALNPETMHAICMLFTERGIPDGYRHMHGFGVNTFKLINKKLEVHYAKWHLVCKQEIKSLDSSKAAKLAGIDADYATRDLVKAIDDKKYPVWTLSAQVVSEKEAQNLPFNPFDPTKTWPHKQFPLIEVGKLTLDKNVDNFFAQSEQLAFCPGNFVPGVQAAWQDRVLVGRIFAYADTQRYRLGANFTKIPVNKPVCPIATPTYRDGRGTFDDNFGSMANYVPSSLMPKLKLSAPTNKDGKIDPGKTTGWPHPALTEQPQKFEGIVNRYDDSDDDNFSQASVLYTKVLNSEGRDKLATNLANSLKSVTDKKIVDTVLGHFEKVSEQLAKDTLKALKKASK